MGARSWKVSEAKRRTGHGADLQLLSIIAFFAICWENLLILIRVIFMFWPICWSWHLKHLYVVYMSNVHLSLRLSGLQDLTCIIPLVSVQKQYDLVDMLLLSGTNPHISGDVHQYMVWVLCMALFVMAHFWACVWLHEYGWKRVKRAFLFFFFFFISLFLT